MNAVLMNAVIECAAFLALSGDDVIKPDAAVAQLEQLAFLLKDLSQSDRDAFTRYAQDLADQEESASGQTKRVRFLCQLRENLGIRSSQACDMMNSNLRHSLFRLTNGTAC